MKFTVSEPKPWKRVLEIEVPSTVVQEELDSAYRRYRKEIRMPGFRQGKVPLDVLKARLGNEIRAEVLEHLIPEYLKQAGAEAEIKPISTPVIEDLDYEEGQSLRFRASLEVKPPIDLKEYKGIRVIKRAVNVTEEDISRALDALRDRYANIVRVDGEAQRGHYLVADVQHLDATGVPLIGRKDEKQYMRIGSGLMGEGFDEHLVGVRAGEERRVKTTYPDTYPDKERAGQTAEFLIHVHEVLEKILPEPDDEFAVDVGAEDLDGLKTSIRRDLEQEPDRAVRGQIVRQLVESYDFEVPESMLSGYLDQMVSDARRGSRQPVDEEALRQTYRPVAIEHIKQILLLDAIAEQEHIEVSPAELDDRLRGMADRLHISLDQLKRLFRENGRIHRIEADIREEKVVEFLMQHADIRVE